MGKIAVFRCANIDLDVYDSERIPVGMSENLYYVTPHRIDLIEQWINVNGIDKIRTKEQVQQLVSLELIGVY